MPAKRIKAPSYRKHKVSGQAVVTLDGRDFYLGPHGTKASHAEYDRLVAEWLANRRQLPRSAGGPAQRGFGPVRLDVDVHHCTTSLIGHAQSVRAACLTCTCLAGVSVEVALLRGSAAGRLNRKPGASPPHLGGGI